MVDWPELICEFPNWRLILMADVILLLLLTYPLLLVEPGTAAHAVMIIDLLVLVPLFFLAAGMIHRCSKRKDV